MEFASLVTDDHDDAYRKISSIQMWEIHGPELIVAHMDLRCVRGASSRTLTDRFRDCSI